MSPWSTLDCPSIQTSFKDDKGSNMWLVEKLAPCRFGAVYLKGRRDRVVVLNRFSTFLIMCLTDSINL